MQSPVSAQISRYVNSLKLSASVTVCLFHCFQLLFTNSVCKFVCIPEDPVVDSKEMPAKKMASNNKNKQVKETLQSMSLCNVLSQSVLSGAKLLKHLAHTKKLIDHLAAMATHFRGQWASPRQPITPLNPPPPYSSYVFHLPIHPSPLTSQWRSRVRPRKGFWALSRHSDWSTNLTYAAQGSNSFRILSTE